MNNDDERKREARRLVDTAIDLLYECDHDDDDATSALRHLNAVSLPQVTAPSSGVTKEGTVLAVEPADQPGWWDIGICFDCSGERHATFPMRGEQAPPKKPGDAIHVRFTLS